MILAWLFDTEICRLCGHVGARENKETDENFICTWCGNSQRQIQSGRPKINYIVDRIAAAFAEFIRK
jgi:hypothetical protein